MLFSRISKSGAEFKTQCAIILAFALSWIPLLRFGFDSHHDGLIVSTVNNLTLVSSGAGNSPFNQYGPAWFLILRFFSSLFDSTYFFLSLRICTLCFYYLSFLFTYLLARKFLSQKQSLFAVIFLMGIQPFVSDYNSDLIPWPSAFSMALIPLAALSILNALAQESIPKTLGYVSLSTLSIVLIILTRVQIGIALFVSLISLLIFYKKIRLAFLSISFFTFWIGIAFTFMIRMNWFSDFLSDVFKFGSLYVRGDTSTYPKPLATLIVTIVVVVILEFIRFNRFQRLLQFRFLKYAYSLLFLFLVLAVFVLHNRSLSPIQILSVGFRRFWISLLIAILVYYLIEFLRKWFTEREIPPIELSVLFVFSVVAEVQVLPLFDQMHSWWASTPSVILFALIFSRGANFQSIEFKYIRIFLRVGLLGLLIIYSLTFLSSISHERVPLPVRGYSGILLSKLDSKEISTVNTFLRKEIPRHNSVLNLCTNGNPFFESNMKVTSASRAFVFWPPMMQISELRDSLIHAKPDNIVTCSFVTNPIFYQDYKVHQTQILNEHISQFKEAAFLKSPNGVEWVVYSRIY